MRGFCHFLWIIGLFIITSGCRKYDEGGFYRLTKSHITRTWKLDKVTFCGEDITNKLQISDVVQVFKRNGNYSFQFTNQQGQRIEQNGNWSYEKAEKPTWDIMGGFSKGSSPSVHIFVQNVSNDKQQICPGVWLPSSQYVYINKLDHNEFEYIVLSDLSFRYVQK